MRWLELTAAELLLQHLDPSYVPLVRFLIATGIRWGEAAALQVKDLHLGDGVQLSPCPAGSASASSTTVGEVDLVPGRRPRGVAFWVAVRSRPGDALRWLLGCTADT